MELNQQSAVGGFPAYDMISSSKGIRGEQKLQKKVPTYGAFQEKALLKNIVFANTQLYRNYVVVLVR